MAYPAEPTTRDAAPLSTGSDDWAVQAADTVERVVQSVRARTTGPVTTVARLLVFGLLAGILGLAAAVLVTAGIVRAIDVYEPFEQEVWLAHLVVGMAFTAIGLILWSKRRPKGAE